MILGNIYDPKWRLTCPRNFRPPPYTLYTKKRSCAGTHHMIVAGKMFRTATERRRRAALFIRLHYGSLARFNRPWVARFLFSNSSLSSIKETDVIFGLCTNDVMTLTRRIRRFELFPYSLSIYIVYISLLFTDRRIFSLNL